VQISDANVIDKLRGLFLYMWRSINRGVPRAVTERRNVSTYAGDLISGAMLFNKRFTAQWAADNYRDYLSPEAAPIESGQTVLGRLLTRGAAEASAAAMGAGAPAAGSAYGASGAYSYDDRLGASAGAAGYGAPPPPPPQGGPGAGASYYSAGPADGGAGSSGLRYGGVGDYGY
jgi:hypothetical protein